MSLTPVKNVRIKSLDPGAVVKLRFGKAAVKGDDDVFVTAKLKAHREEGEKSFAIFEETDADNNVTETTISRYPGAAWRYGNQYVSLAALDKSTFTPPKTASPITTDDITRVIGLIEAEPEDVYGAELLIALLTEIRDGKRINVGVKTLANQLSAKMADELTATAA